jgi:hypothetical protein
MSKGSRVLSLYLVGARTADRERAELLVDRLSSRRRVSGSDDRWSVLYESGDVSEAMRMCEADLSDLDPGWMQVLDFKAVPSRANSDAEFG